MGRSILARMMAVFLTAQTLPAAGPAIKTTWSGFQQQVAQGKLKNRTAWISVSDGGEFKTTLLRAEGDFLVVRTDRNTKRWATKTGEAMIPKDSVSAVRFTGKIGRRGLIGGLTGLGAGAGITAAAAADGGNCEGSSCGAVLLLVPVLAVVGYFVGHAADKPAPAFIIEH